MNVGDVYWVEFPPRGGHAQAGRRPAIVLQSASRAAGLPTVLLVPLTTQLDALRFPEPFWSKPTRKTAYAALQSRSSSN